MTDVSTIYDKEPFDRERPERSDESDRIVNEKKDEYLEKKYSSNKSKEQ